MKLLGRMNMKNLRSRGLATITSCRSKDIGVMHTVIKLKGYLRTERDFQDKKTKDEIDEHLKTYAK